MYWTTQEKANHFLGIEEIKEKRDEVTRQIVREEEEAEKIVQEIRVLNERLAKLEDSLQKKYATKNEYDRTIRETEAAYVKVRFVKPHLMK